jgi:threonine/homoserine/homoserine lactone efflux protein
VALLFVVRSAIPGVVGGLQLAGGAYLGYLALCLLRANHSSNDDAENPAFVAGRYFRRGFLTNILNPKAILFYLALVAPVVEAAGSVWSVGAILLAVALGPPLWFLTLAGFSARLVRWLTPVRRRAIDLVSSILFLVLAVVSLASGLRSLL